MQWWLRERCYVFHIYRVREKAAPGRTGLLSRAFEEWVESRIPIHSREEHSRKVNSMKEEETLGMSQEPQAA